MLFPRFVPEVLRDHIAATYRGIDRDDVDQWSLSTATVRDAPRETTRVIVVNTPDDPTGWVADATQLGELADTTCGSHRAGPGSRTDSGRSWRSSTRDARAHALSIVENPIRPGPGGVAHP